MEGSIRYACFLGGVVDTRFIGFLGDGEPEELLPDDEAEGERLLQDNININQDLLCRYGMMASKNYKGKGLQKSY